MAHGNGPAIHGRALAGAKRCFANSLLAFAGGAGADDAGFGHAPMFAWPRLRGSGQSGVDEGLGGHREGPLARVVVEDVAGQHQLVRAVAVDEGSDALA